MITRTPRQIVVDALELHGCGYVDRDTVTAVCPLCGDALAVSFTAQRVSFRCCFTGCDEQAIAAAVAGRIG